ncbi:MAG TPA: two-component regulator propeller domain-containing protein [Verrucomicrobiota bacterium]|nr:two-component regulator propeller domain-containing protein [Verrucomicrobiota bacterium]
MHASGWRGAILSAALGLSLWMHAADSGLVPLERDFTVRVWRKEHGLPDDRVLALLRDDNGFIWVGTRRGVSRFDGRQFKTWSRSTHDVFASEVCQALAQDLDGTIWVATARGDTPHGLIRLGQEPRRVDLPSLPTLPAPETVSITSLAFSPAGDLLVGSTHGLAIRCADGVWRGVDDGTPFSTSRYTAWAVGSDGTVWAVIGRTVFYRRPGPDTPWNKETIPSSLADTQHYDALAVTKDGVLHAIVSDAEHWISRLVHRHAGGWEIESTTEQAHFKYPLILMADAAGGLWFPIASRVLGYRLNGVLTRYDLAPHDFGLGFSCLTEDAEGNLWAGTARSGLVCLLPGRIRNLGIEQGLPDPKARALLEASDGTLWAGTDGGVVQLSQHQPRLLNNASGLASDMIRALAEDAQGRVWIGTGRGLSFWDGQALEMVLFPGADFRTKTRALLKARDGAMWIGAAQGLYRLGADRTNAWLVADGLPHENVCALHEDRQGQIWIGTGGGGLARLTDQGFERFDESNGLSSSRVYAIEGDAGDALWIGTDRGLNVLRGGRVAVFTTAHGLPDNLVNSIVEDTRGWLWIGHDRGIYRVKRQELIEVAEDGRARARCVSYAEEDGLLNPETNGQNSYPPAIRLRDGRVAFATMGGVALFDPDTPPDLTNGPCVHIETLRAGERVIFTGGPGPEAAPVLHEPERHASSLASRLSPTRLLFGEGNRSSATTHSDGARAAEQRLIVKPADRGLLSLDFTVAAFRAPARVRCRYRLLGLSPDWTDAGALRQATFSGLNPGSYTFEVTAQNHHGYTSPMPARLSFSIEPRWHERAWVRLVGAVLVPALVAVAVRWRMRALRRLSRLEQQAALASERARLAKDLHDGLGASLTEITLLSGVGEAKPLSPEAIADRFDRLSRRTHDALHSLRDLIWTTNPKADSLELLMSRICASAESALGAAGLRVRLDFPADLPQVILGPEARKALLLATNEAVNNAIRHAQATQVRLRLRIEGARLVIEIEDDGRGFDAAEAARRGDSADYGLGLSSMRERITSLRGQFDLQSQPGRGTKVIFRVPLPRETSA